MPSHAVIDGGYYCKTQENRPLVGPLPVAGAYVIGALSGMGLMSAHACAELLSLHVAGLSLPDYARWFLPSRYDDPAYQALVTHWGPLAGQCSCRCAVCDPCTLSSQPQTHDNIDTLSRALHATDFAYAVPRLAGDRAGGGIQHTRARATHD